MIKEVWLALKEAIRMIFDMVYTSTSIYISGLKKLIRNSAIATLALLGVSILLALFSIYWPLKLSVFVIGLIFITLLIAAFPVLVLASVAQEEVPAIRRMFRLYAAIVFWIFQVMIYFSIVPIQNAPAAIPLVLLLFATIAFGFVAYGFKVGVSPKWAMIRTVVILCLVTFFLFIPQTHEYINLAAEKINEKITIWVKAPRAIEYRPDLAFFDMVTGEPKVWFCKKRDGGFDLFDQRGFHPATREKLQPVTPEAVNQILEWQKEEERRREETAAAEQERRRIEAEEREKAEREAKQKEEEQQKTEAATAEPGRQEEVQPERKLSETERQALINSPHRLYNRSGFPAEVFDGEKPLGRMRINQSWHVLEPVSGFWAILLVPDDSGATKETRVRVDQIDTKTPLRKDWIVTTIPLPETFQPGIETEQKVKAEQKIVIPQNTPIDIRLATNLSTDSNSSGQEFTAHLTRPLIAEGFVIAERNAKVKGVIVQLKKAGRIRGVSSLSFRLVEIKAANGAIIDIKTGILKVEGKTSRGSDIAKILGGAAAGAVIGSLAGDEKTAAEGATAGSAAGAVAVLATRGKSLELPSEIVLRFYLTEPVFLPK